MRELVEDRESDQTPTVLIGSRVIVGFHPDEYESALRLLEN